MVKYLNNRISYSEKNGELLIVISGQVEKWQESMLFGWLIAWTVCGGFVFYELFSGEYGRDESLMLVIYLAFWAYFELKIGYVYLWRKFGAELIKVDKEGIHVKKDIKSYGKAVTYFKENIKSIERMESKPRSFAKVFGTSFWTLTEKAISFFYMEKLIAFGIQLNEKDAKKLAKMIINHLRKMA